MGLTGAGGKSTNSKSEGFLLSKSEPTSGTILRPAYINNYSVKTNIIAVRGIH